MREPTAAELALATRVRAALIDDWKRIRLLCPRGHYISDVTIGVPILDEDRDRAPLWLWPHASNAKMSGDMTSDRVIVAWHHDSRSTAVKLVCGHARCAYHGKREMFTLAVEAGAAALAGHAEYTLTS